ncbi:hypothetical protein [Mucilaginibacter sp. SP1R1]|uniref:hypothetical protein n=1 Tax=Mucilaginibacter sp. SP1R1 TaxID=2723091 RepID=UPI001613CE82|nr:hypothetical protein [Mucilaginibacter sp. SP1R1]MBB6149625.1 putative nucleotide-binding protein [Mucilaginibacter sp. SP1R1]
MDHFYWFLIAGLVLVYLILQFDKQQRHKANTLKKQTNDVQPLLLMQSLGRKLNRLNEALTMAKTGGHIEDQLKKITADYNCGRIDMQTYNNRLNELLQKAEAK